MASVINYSQLSNSINNNAKINDLLKRIGTSNKSLFNKLTFKKGKSTELLEILERKIKEFINTLTFDNLGKKLLELQKFSERINLTSKKIIDKKDDTLSNKFLYIFSKYRLLFPAFSAKILTLLNQSELNINNLSYFSFIIDNLISLYLKIFSSNQARELLDKDKHYKDMLKVQEIISKEFDIMPEIKTNNLNTEKNEYMLREKILASSIEIYKQALKSKGEDLEKLKVKLQELIDFYKQKFINSRQNQVFPLNQKTLNNYKYLLNNLNNKNNRLAHN